jgi:enoyl-CoA hydratase
MDTGYEKLRLEVAASGVATVTLDDPGTRNALSGPMLAELTDAIERVRTDAAIRCLVLTSSHDRVFSSGGDLSGFEADDGLVSKHFANERFSRLLRAIPELGKPSICAANGHVLAGALGLALACDLVVAAEEARFGTPEINVGLFPFMIMALIYRNVPQKRAAEMLLLGEQLGAAEAVAMGLANRAVPKESLPGVVEELATKLAAKSPVLMKLGKDAMLRQQDMALADAFDFLRSQLSLALSTDDVKEGVRAFFEKREPQWTGR